MSEENVEIIRRGFEHWSATGEIRAHPDFVWDVSRLGWPDEQIYLGAEGANRFNDEWADAWDDWELELEDLLDAGESVVAIVNQRGRSKATGIPVDMRFAQVWTFRDEAGDQDADVRERGGSPRGRGAVAARVASSCPLVVSSEATRMAAGFSDPYPGRSSMQSICTKPFLS